MKRPKTSESKYWGNDRFRHLLFIEDLEDYTTALEEQIAKNCVIPAVKNCTTCKFTGGRYTSRKCCYCSRDFSMWKQR